MRYKQSPVSIFANGVDKMSNSTQAHTHKAPYLAHTSRVPLASPVTFDLPDRTKDSGDDNTPCITIDDANKDTWYDVGVEKTQDVTSAVEDMTVTSAYTRAAVSLLSLPVMTL